MMKTKTNPNPVDALQDIQGLLAEVWTAQAEMPPLEYWCRPETGEGKIMLLRPTKGYSFGDFYLVIFSPLDYDRLLAGVRALEQAYPEYGWTGPGPGPGPESAKITSAYERYLAHAHDHDHEGESESD